MRERILTFMAVFVFVVMEVLATVTDGILQEQAE